jgi:hypothetical protein
MNDKDKLSYPLLIVGLFGMCYFISSLLNYNPCWEAGILFAVSYGFVVLPYINFNNVYKNEEQNSKASAKRNLAINKRKS